MADLLNVKNIPAYLKQLLDLSIKGAASQGF